MSERSGQLVFGAARNPGLGGAASTPSEGVADSFAWARWSTQTHPARERGGRVLARRKSGWRWTARARTPRGPQTRST
eukprot:576400-Prymnesium_polylepis.1